jgi:ABC-type molybdenum transport system ATPase subunit/photorepair protein PhrA
MNQDNFDSYKELHRFGNDLERAELNLKEVDHDIGVLEKELSEKRIHRLKVLNTIASTKTSINKVADILSSRL